MLFSLMLLSAVCAQAQYVSPGTGEKVQFTTLLQPAVPPLSFPGQPAGRPQFGRQPHRHENAHRPPLTTVPCLTPAASFDEMADVGKKQRKHVLPRGRKKNFGWKSGIIAGKVVLLHREM